MLERSGPYRWVDKPTYDKEAGNRITPTDPVLKVGWFCVARQINPEQLDLYNNSRFAFDEHVRVDVISEPDDYGNRTLKLAVVDADGLEVTENGEPKGGEGILGSDGFMYKPGSTVQDGYLLGDDNTWDISGLHMMHSAGQPINLDSLLSPVLV